MLSKFVGNDPLAHTTTSELSMLINERENSRNIFSSFCERIWQIQIPRLTPFHLVVSQLNWTCVTPYNGLWCFLTILCTKYFHLFVRERISIRLSCVLKRSLNKKKWRRNKSSSSSVCQPFFKNCKDLFAHSWKNVSLSLST